MVCLSNPTGQVIGSMIAKQTVSTSITGPRMRVFCLQHCDGAVEQQM